MLIRLSESVPGRMLRAGTLQSRALRPRLEVASPFQTGSLYLLHDGRVTTVDARGGIPSLERTLGDPETTQVAAWRNAAADESWVNTSASGVLRQIDRFHPIPDVPRWQRSWAEWLYFNGRSGNTRFYLTFMVGPRTTGDRRAAGVRLQLEREGRIESYTGAAEIPEAAALRAPDLAIGGSSVQLRDLTYVVHLDLASARGERVRGDITLAASPGKPRASRRDRRQQRLAHWLAWSRSRAAPSMALQAGGRRHASGPAGRHRLSRPQLGLLGRERVLAVGTGTVG